MVSYLLQLKVMATEKIGYRILIKSNSNSRLSFLIFDVVELVMAINNNLDTRLSVNTKNFTL